MQLCIYWHIDFCFCFSENFELANKLIGSLLYLQLEKQVNEVEQFYSASGNSSIVKDKDREKHFTSIKKQQQDTSYREAAASKRMLELMRQFATILRQASTKSLHLSLMYKSGLSLRYSCKFHG